MVLVAAVYFVNLLGLRSGLAVVRLPLLTTILKSGFLAIVSLPEMHSHKTNTLTVWDAAEAFFATLKSKFFWLCLILAC